MPGTVTEALTEGVRTLREAGVENPRLDAELLLAHALGRDRTFVLAHLPDPLPREAAERYRELLQRRARREPLPYILGRWEFLGLPFRVTPAVLIPRPETETLVEAAAARLPEDARILDVGAGSGCVAIGLAKRLPRAVVTALEPSPEAAAVARENAAALGVADRVTVLEAAFPEGARGLGPFHAVVSNPPYIPSEEIERLQPEVRLYEPRAALDGGPDGMALLRPLVQESPALLLPGGLLAVEVAAGQAERVRRCLRESGAWGEPEIVEDLAGVPRVLLARRVTNATEADLRGRRRAAGPRARVRRPPSAGGAPSPRL